ncbi:amidohydrolase [Svornostia abyssi]|uniref:Amidohydrolase n=1 Tax=Svornostia abyssi TaxID=2898438 RepID=A0ABY5PLZ3_9ACTN|nr:amidohydrolase [Parviterribacteraceae bacterium J379]
MPVPDEIPFAEYRSAVETPTQAELEIAQDFATWLPDVVVDAHVHNALPEHVIQMTPRSLGHMASSFPWSSVEDSRRLHRQLFPDTEVRCLRFAKAHPGYDHRAINEWLRQEIVGSQDRFALFGLQDDPEWTANELVRLRPAALKMYYMITEPPGTTIEESFPPLVLQTCAELGTPIILHLPRPITESISELERVVDRYAGLIVVLAHLGVPLYSRPGLAEAYERVRALPNVHMDTACMEHADVVSMAGEIVGWERVMYGSDDPISLLRAAPYVHPTKGPRVVPVDLMHWTDEEEYAAFGHLGKDAVLNHWQQLEAIAEALRGRSEEQRIKQAVMCDNATALFRFSLQT